MSLKYFLPRTLKFSLCTILSTVHCAYLSPATQPSVSVRVLSLPNPALRQKTGKFRISYRILAEQKLLRIVVLVKQPRFTSLVICTKLKKSWVTNLSFPMIFIIQSAFQDRLTGKCQPHLSIKFNRDKIFRFYLQEVKIPSCLKSATRGSHPVIACACSSH